MERSALWLLHTRQAHHRAAKLVPKHLVDLCTFRAFGPVVGLLPYDFGIAWLDSPKWSSFFQISPLKRGRAIRRIVPSLDLVLHPKWIDHFSFLGVQHENPANH